MKDFGEKLSLKCPKCGNEARFDLFCSESWLVYFYQDEKGKLMVDETLTEASRQREYGDIFCADCDEVVIQVADHKAHHDLLARLRLAAGRSQDYV